LPGASAGALLMLIWVAMGKLFRVMGRSGLAGSAVADQIAIEPIQQAQNT
jgi:hypothetical protein